MPGRNKENKKLFAFTGDYKPVKVTKGDKVLFEPTTTAKEGDDLAFDKTYNYHTEIEAKGKSYQEEDYYREKEGQSSYQFSDNKEDHLRKAEVSLVTEQPQYYLREKTGEVIEIEDHEEDKLREFSVAGDSIQPQRYYREATSTTTIQILQHAKNILDKARIDTTAQQTQEYYRELSGAGVIAVPTHKENALRKGIISTVAQQMVTVQGKNLIDSSRLEQGTYFDTVIGQPVVKQDDVTLLNIRVRISRSILPNTQYMLSCNFQTYEVFVIFADSSGNALASYGWSASAYTVTTPANAYHIYTIFRRKDNATFTTASIRIDGNIQLELGSVATTYAPFVPNSPSPDYPAPITGYSALNLYQSGINLFHTQAWYSWLRTFTTLYVMKEVVDDINCIKYQPPYSYDKKWMLGKFKPNTQYTISFRAKGIVGTNVSTGFALVYTNGARTWTYVANVSEWSTYAITSTVGYTVSHIEMHYANSQGCYFDENSIQLEEGATATPYEAAGSDNPLPLQAPMYGLTGAVDSRDVNGLEIHRSAIKTFTASDYWSSDVINASGIIRFIGPMSLRAPLSPSICSMLPHKLEVIAQATTEGFSTTTYGTNIYVAIKASRLDGATYDLSTTAGRESAFRAWLSTNTFTVLYQLAAPVTYTNAATPVALSTGANNLFSDIGTVLVSYQVPTGENIAGDIQSPHPDYPAAISGYSALNLYGRGKNLCPNPITDSIKNGVTVTVNADKSITLNGTATASVTLSMFAGLMKLPAGKYTASISSGASLNIQINAIGGNNRYATFTVLPGENITYMWYWWPSGTVFNNITACPQLELGSLATAYEPYSGVDTALPLQATAYGLAGAVDSRDQNGLEVHRTAIYNAHDLSYSIGDSTGQPTDSSLMRLAIGVVYTGESLAPISTHFKSGPTFVSASVLESIYGHSVAGANTTITIRKDRLAYLGYSDSLTYAQKAAMVKQYFTDRNTAGDTVKFLIPLPSPVSYTNAAQDINLVDGLNNVFSDAGTLNIGYEVPEGQNIAGDLVSPLPDYPSPIISSAGELRVEGRNLLSTNVFKSNSGLYGVTFLPLRELYNSLPEGTTITISYKWDSNGTAIPPAGQVYFRFSDDSNSGAKNTFTKDSRAATSATLYASRDTYGATYQNFYDITVVRGIVEKPYTPYRPIITHELPELRAIPDGAGGWIARDELTVERVGGEWHWMRTQRVGHRVFDGTEPFGKNSQNALEYTYILAVAHQTNGGVCNRLPRSPTPTQPANTFNYTYNGNFLFFTFSSSLLPSNTLTEMRSLLASWHAAGDPLTVDYQLATPIVTDLGIVTLPPLYSPYTRLYSTSDVPYRFTAAYKLGQGFEQTESDIASPHPRIPAPLIGKNNVKITANENETSLVPQQTLWGLTGAEDKIGIDGKESHKTELLTYTGVEAQWYLSGSGDSSYFQITFVLPADAANREKARCTHALYDLNPTSTVPAMWLDSGGLGFRFKHPAYNDDLAGFKAWLSQQNALGNPVRVVYPKATPTLIQNTPQSLLLNPGQNNVQADAGKLAISYQVKNGMNIVGDVVSPTPNYSARIISSAGEARVEGRNVINVPDYAKGAAYSHSYPALASALNDLPKNVPLRAWYALDTDGVPRAAAVQGGYMYVVYEDGANQTMRYEDAFQLADKQVRSANIYGADSVNDHATYNRFYNFCVTRADQSAKKFTPYRPIITTPIPELRGIPDGSGGWAARDELYVERVGGEWHLMRRQRVGRKVFDGTEPIALPNWRPFAGSYAVGYAQSVVPSLPEVSATGLPILCDHLHARSYNSLYAGTSLGASVYTGPNYGLFLRVPDTVAADTAGWRAYLATQYAAGTPVTVDYILATPIITDLGAIDLPSYYPYTRVLVSGDYPPDVTASALSFAEREP